MPNERMSNLWILLIKFQLISYVGCLKDLRITVPEAVANGDTVTLTCDYDLEATALYCVRWYFEPQVEFYRYVPKESPPSRTFNISTGVTVDISKSNEHTVTLLAVNRNQSGLYQCEVSADLPLFHTESAVGYMTVVDLPAGEPTMKIYGFQITDEDSDDQQNTVSVGDEFKMACVSGPSTPPVNFTWSINGIRQTSSLSGVRNVKNGLEAWSEMIVHVTIEQSVDRMLRIRCEANIFQLYRGAVEMDVVVIEPDGSLTVTISRGDPDNSPLTGRTDSLAEKCLLFRLIFSIVIFSFFIS